MKKNGLISLMMSVLLILSMLPSMVFAGELTVLEGELKVKGDVQVGSELSANYESVQPEGMTDDLVSFLWERKLSEEETKELSKEKTYVPTEEDLGYEIILTVTGREEMGYTGSLKVKTEAVTMPPAEEEAQEAVPEESDAGQEVPEEAEYSDLEENADEAGSYEEYYDGDPGYDQAEDAGVSEEYYAEDAGYDEMESSDDSDEDYSDDGYYDDGSEYVDDSEDLRGLTDQELEELNGGNDSEEIIDETGEDDWDSENDALDDDWDVEEEVYVDGQLQNGEEAGADPYADETVPTEEDVEGEDQEAEEETDGGLVAEGAGIAADPEIVNLTAEEGSDYTALSAAVVLTYTGEEPITLYKPDQCQMFDITGFEEDSVVLNNEDTLEITITPKSGYEFQIGENSEEIVIRSDLTPEAAKISVSFVVTEKVEEPVYSLSLDPEDGVLDFGITEEGYTQDIFPQKEVIITNDGNQPITLYKPETEFFDIVFEDSVTLNPGDFAVMSIVPKADLPADIYDTELPISTDHEGTEPVLQLLLTVDVPSYYELSVEYENENEVLDFGSEYVGYSGVEFQTVTIVNTGNQLIEVFRPDPEEYPDYLIEGFGEEQSRALDVGEELSLRIVPVDGLPAGSYDDVITIATEIEDVTAEIVTSFTVEEEEPDYTLTCTPDSLKAWSAEEGYGDRKARTVELANEGNQLLHLISPEPRYYTVKLGATELEPGETTTASIQPKTGLKEGSYSGKINFKTEEGAQASVAVSFTVSAKVLKITKVLGLSPITGIANGAEKSVAGLKLPGSVRISTTDGEMDAAVTWDVNGCAYDPKATQEQTFTVKGTITLPKGVKNPDGLSLAASVQVTVNAYSPRLAAPADNRITGVSGVYAPRAEIKFTAVGAGMDNSSPRKGDTRFVPVRYTVGTITKEFDSASYQRSFGMANTGDYTLTVEFQKEEYNGSAWVKVQPIVTDTKSVSFTVSDSVNSPTVTPTPGLKNSNQKDPAQTGDDTNILPFIIALICAAVCVVGVVIYKKKK